MRSMLGTAATAVVAAVVLIVITPAEAATALVVQDNVALRAAAKDSAPVQAQLARGEALEIRGERFDHFQVYDYRRERGGFVRKSQVMTLEGGAGEPSALLATLRLVRQQPGAESLGLGLAAAYVQAATAEQMNGAAGVEVLDAMGSLSERLADRASRNQPRADGTPSPADVQVAAQLDVAARYGIRFRTLERESGTVQLCYDGEAFRRVLVMPAASAEQQARAALSLTRADCLAPATTPAQREPLEQWRADVLDKVDIQALPTYWRNRVLMRQVAVWSSLADVKARRDAMAVAATVAPSQQAAQQAAAKALSAFASISPTDLADDDQSTYNDAVMRGNAARWLATMAASSEQMLAGLRLTVQPGEPGETCVTLSAATSKDKLLRHCGWGLVSASSARVNREGTAVALASVPTDGWRELWLLRKTAQGWRLTVLPPAAAQPGIGYAELAGFVPGGKEMLVARESRAEGRYRRSYELVDLDSLETRRQAGDASMLGAFQRWQAADWKAGTLSLR
ncbi:hypothetical protein OU995_06575 [Roseateles sp. SL47]|uniref:hypothetical protein n=1 Tax=Roseateles sp. SL47 TaxID=2995138 RepID=UPI00226F2A93|nr:hypothetical protein [Roseateles sp. SL47]WAC74378.1 hypothetical protein OU995_06575 [Roseateles sp. SL47]